jgi:CubicO group peptidase (beta-lactamase class C family)
MQTQLQDLRCGTPMLKSVATSMLGFVLMGISCAWPANLLTVEQKNPASAEQERLARFEKQVEELRALLKIPGLSAAIVKDQKVVWAKGFGMADLERRIPVTPDTPQPIASLTKTFAATLLMQLVEQGKLDLDEPVARYSDDFKDDRVRIRHLLSHTSEGTPGDRYQYNGSRYDYLTAVIEKRYGKSFRELLVQTFIEPLGMSNTVPGHDLLAAPDKWSGVLGSQRLTHYQGVLAKLAQPYRLYGDEIIHTPYPPRGIGAAAGLISTVTDLARFEAALDRNQFLKKETQQRAWTPFTSNSGQPLPHGLGWFVRNYQGGRFIWHYGHWPDSFSATLLKVPDKSLTLILLANSDGLSAPFYRTGGIETNVLACTFLRLFVFEEQQGRLLPDPPWSKKPEEFAAETSRLARQTNGYGYECESASHSAMMKWIEDRRAQARKPAKVDTKIYSAYLGEYQLNPNRTFTVSREGDRLIIDIPRGSKSELLPESEQKFFLKVADVEVRFLRDDKGQITDLEILANGQQARAKKIK